MGTKTTVHIPVRGDRTSRLPLPTNSRDEYRGSRRHKKDRESVYAYPHVFVLREGAAGVYWRRSGCVKMCVVGIV